MRRLLPPAVALGLLCSTASCGGSSGAPVPRPEGYPRIAVCDSVHKPIDGLPLHLEINASAVGRVDSVRPDGTAWVTVDYPTYGHARLYLTVSPASEAVMANRRERMSLNTGGAPTELTELMSAGDYLSAVAVTPSGSATPVQILSTNWRYVVSGAFFLEAAATAPDSVRPVVEAVRSDLIHAAKTLR